jgi:hypothetical protein
MAGHGLFEKQTMKKSEENRIFREACIGYGFEEIQQTPDGTYCTGCETIHKRPTKMFKAPMNKDVLCRYQVIRLYNPEE